MELTTIIVIGILAYGMYLMYMAYQSVVDELREIRLKCVKSGETEKIEAASNTDNYNGKVKQTLESFLGLVKKMI